MKPFPKTKRRHWFDLGFDAGKTEGLKERVIMEKREISRQAKYNEQIARLGNIIKLAKQEADRIIEKAHEDADEIREKAKQKLIISKRNYEVILRHREAIEDVANDARTMLVKANKIELDASNAVAKSRISVEH